MEVLVNECTKPLSPNYSIVFSYEASFQPKASREWMARNWYYALYYIVLYVTLIYAGRRYMKNRPGYELRALLFVWNVALAIFSIIGTFRTWPEFLYVLKEFGLRYSACNPSYLTHCKVTSFWTWMFILSKAPELMDTMFIIARKRKLIFLHWYHHITVLLFFWYGYHDFSAVGRWYVNLNYFVHSLMYSYFAMRVVGIRLTAWIRKSITIVQIVQMVVAVFATWVAYDTKRRGQFCQIADELLRLCFFTGMTYIILFVKFFYDEYVPKSSKLLRNKKEM